MVRLVFRDLYFKLIVFWVAAALIILFAVGMGVFVLAQHPNNTSKLPSKSYFGVPAIASDLLIETIDDSPINFMGKWRVESINTFPVAPADDWLEKSAEAYIQFEIRGDEIVLVGYSGCNGFGGQAYVLGGQLHVPELTATQRGCSINALVDQENTLIDILSSIGAWATPRTQNASIVSVGSKKVGFIQLSKLLD